MTPSDEHNDNHQTMIDEQTLIWAMSPRGKYAHAYTGEKALNAGIPLCGIRCIPTQILEHFDLSNEIVQKVACPDCLTRLAYAKYFGFKPFTELDKPHEPDGRITCCPEPTEEQTKILTPTNV